MSTILILSSHPQGQNRLLGELVRELTGSYKVIVESPVTGESGEKAITGAELIASPEAKSGVHPILNLKLARQYQHILEKYRPDLVMTYGSTANLCGGYICTRKKIPYIATVTGPNSDKDKEGLSLELVNHAYREGLRGASCVFFRNRENLDSFRFMHLITGKYRLVPGSGVNLEYWSAMEYPEHGNTEFLFAGRITPDKGIREYLNAAKVLQSEKIQFLIAGKADTEIQAELERHQKDGTVILLGNPEDRHEAYRRCSAVVLPTYHEGMSDILMEASSCARPVLASNINGCREIFEDGVTGFGFAPKSTDALVDAMRGFLTLSKADRAAMGRAARYKMEREFDRRKVINAYMEEISGILTERSANRPDENQKAER